MVFISADCVPQANVMSIGDKQETKQGLPVGEGSKAGARVPE